MRVAVLNAQVPFVRGGGEALADNLIAALRTAGHHAELIQAPFYREPATALRQQVAYWRQLQFENFWFKPDCVISLKYPCYFAEHPQHSVWLLHELREYYGLFNHVFTASERDARRSTQQWVHGTDKVRLAQLSRRFCIAKRVASRLEEAIGVDFRTLYHPPPNADVYYCERPQDYILVPSRLEGAKRQDLAIRAMKYVTSPLSLVIVGTGTAREHYEALAHAEGVAHRVRFMGRVEGNNYPALYAHCLGVFFGPLDEDYGYITLEAMLSEKPVVTCTDSGGPLEFVHDAITGDIVAPDAKAIAERFDVLHADKHRAQRMGQAGRAAYQALNLSWQHVVESLVP